MPAPATTSHEILCATCGGRVATRLPSGVVRSSVSKGVDVAVVFTLTMGEGSVTCGHLVRRGCRETRDGRVFARYRPCGAETVLRAG